MQRHCHQTIASSRIRADIDVIKANCNQAVPGISSGLSDWPQAWQSLDYAIAFPIAMKHARSLPEHAQSADGASIGPVRVKTWMLQCVSQRSNYQSGGYSSASR
jgi:hypothetical protein